MIKKIIILIWILFIPSICLAWGPIQAFDSGIDCQYELDSYTVLQIDFNATDGSQVFTDASASAHTVTGVTNAEASATGAKFGQSGVSFDGISGHVTVPDSDDFNLGSGTYTIETWVMFRTVPGAGNQDYIYYQDSGASYYRLSYDGTSDSWAWRAKDSTGGVQTINAYHTPSPNTWYHIAVIGGWGNDPGNYALTIDGTKVANTCCLQATLQDSIAPVYIGGANAGNMIDGYIDEFRITKGISRWKENFKSPTKPYCE